MANRFWVGGAGTWNNASTANWSATTGGASGASVPTSADSVFFDASSGTGTVSVASTAAANDVTANAANITVQLTANAGLGTGAGYSHQAGTLDLNNFALTTNSMTCNTTSTRTIAFGTSGKIIITRSTATTWAVDFYNATTVVTLTGTPVIDFTGATLAGVAIGFRSTAAAPANPIAANIKAGAGTFNFGSGFGYGSIDFTGFTGTLSNIGINLYGNITYVAGMTITAGANALICVATSGTQQITTNAKTLDFPITQSGVGGTVQLQDNLTMGATRTYTLTAGTLDLSSGNRTLSTGLFSSTNTNTRSIAFGTGQINVTGNAGNIWNMANATNFTFTGTSKVNCTYSGATSFRSWQHATTGNTGTNAVNVNVTAGSDQFIHINGSTFLTLDFTGFTGAWTNTTSVCTIYGNLKLVAGMTFPASGTISFGTQAGNTSQITSAAIAFPCGITQNTVSATVQLQDNLTLPSTATYTLTAGTLDLSSGNRTLSTGLFNATNTNTRVIAFGTGNITTVGSGTVWNTSSTTGFSYTGTPTVNISNNSATATTVSTGSMTQAQSLNFNYTTGTYTLTDTSAVYKSVNFTGFNGTIPNSTRTIYGGATFVAGMTLTAGANATTFAATSGTNNITTAKTWDFPITVFGLGGTFAFQDALTMGSTRAFTLTAGTVQFKAGTTNTVGSFVATSGTTKYLQSTTPGTQAIISDASGVNSTNNLTIQDSFATGGATWDAFYGNGNIDGGNNTNWEFGESPVLGNEYEYKLRSMTERRRF